MLSGHWRGSPVNFSILKLQDYRFLEDVARTADQVSRDTFLKRPKRKKYVSISSNLFKFPSLPPGLFISQLSQVATAARGLLWLLRETQRLALRCLYLW